MYTKKTYEKNKEPKTFDSERLYSYGLWLLSRRDYTEYEISEKMKKYQPNEKIINDIILKLINLGYINDERRATNIAKTYLRKESAYKVKRRLADKGINKETIEEVLEECVEEETEIETAKELIMKKFKEYDFDKKQKYCSYLAGRGYSWDIISKAIDYLKNKEVE